MYHYVRPIKGTLFNRIKGLELESFKKQLDYFSNKYEFITAEDVINSVIHHSNLPENSMWLTFDDGYRDHYVYVLPELLKRNIQGSFFPPVKPVVDRELLNVNSIQHILASVDNIDQLLLDLSYYCNKLGIKDSDLRNLWDSCAVASRFDSKEVIYIKRLLQYALPESIRREVVSILFKRYVGMQEAELADLLYMTVDEVKELINAGMYVGSHGYCHLWLNKENEYSQRTEIECSLKFLSSINARTKNWIMCYPFGGYDNLTIKVLEELNCAVGLTSDIGIANLDLNQSLKLPRFDTNDFRH